MTLAKALTFSPFGHFYSCWGRKSVESFSLRNSINFALKKNSFYFSTMRSEPNIQSDELREFDKTQLQLLAEQCILVNEKDEAVGSASKKECHLWENISSKGLLHRAFSVILFNAEKEMLIQQRSEAKITYPNHWTNACCSHPLSTEAEMMDEGAIGVKTAAQRRLSYELGIPPEQVPPESMTFVTRIHYLAQNFPDIRWGEHEIDCILIIKADVDLHVNRNEVRDARYVSQSTLKKLLAESRNPAGGVNKTIRDKSVSGDTSSNGIISSNDVIITPWFRLLCEQDGGLLFKWWDNLDDLGPFCDKVVHKWT